MAIKKIPSEFVPCQLLLRLLPPIPSKLLLRRSWPFTDQLLCQISDGDILSTSLQCVQIMHFCWARIFNQNRSSSYYLDMSQICASYNVSHCVIDYSVFEVDLLVKLPVLLDSPQQLWKVAFLSFPPFSIKGLHCTSPLESTSVIYSSQTSFQ